MCVIYRRSVPPVRLWLQLIDSEWDGVGVNLRNNPSEERRNPFIYIDGQFSEMCKFYIILWHFRHTSPIAFANLGKQKVCTMEARLLYDRKTAARMLSISVRSLDYLIAAKRLDTRRIGKKVLVTHRSLVQFAQGNHYESPAAL